MLKGNIKIFLLLILIIPLTTIQITAEDNVEWRGQYYTGKQFNQGTYEFNFTVYDAEKEGTECYSNITTITTGIFGEWKTAESGVNAACNNASKEYFLEIKIDNITQNERKKLTTWDYIRKNVDDGTTGVLTLSGTLKAQDLKIQSKLMNHTMNVSGFARHIQRNVDPGSSTANIYSLENDAGYQFSIALTSSKYNLTQQFENENRSNLAVLSQNSPNSMQFLNRWGYPFIWRVSYNGSLDHQGQTMVLDSKGNLNITGDFTTNSSGFFVEIGSIQKKITELFVQNININGTINSTGNIIVEKNITIGDQIITDQGCLITQANFWAEESGGISAVGGPEGLQYAYGSSNVKGEGPRQPCSGKIVYLTIQAENALNGDGQVAIVINGNTNSTCNVTTPTTNGGSTQAECNLEFNQGDHLTPRTTITPSGKNNGYIVSWWVIYD